MKKRRGERNTFCSVSIFLFSKLKNCVLDYVFPKLCLGCEKEGEWLCDNCDKKIKRSGIWLGPNDLKQGHLSSLTALTRYDDKSLIGTVLKKYKYNYIEELEDVFARWIAIFLQEKPLNNYDLIVPVPLHKKRYCLRGFNQAQRLGKMVSKIAGIPIGDEVIKRVKNTPQQAKLSRKKRIRNLAGAFIVTKPDIIKGKKIIIVDDVYTTGSTMQAMAKELIESGAKNLSGLTIAKG